MDAKKYNVSVECDNEWAETPAVARFALSKAEAQEIIELSKICSSRHLCVIQKHGCEASYHLSDEVSDSDDDLVRTETERLNISADYFWYTAMAKNLEVPVSFETEQISIRELAEDFGIEMKPVTHA